MKKWSAKTWRIILRSVVGIFTIVIITILLTSVISGMQNDTIIDPLTGTKISP